MGRMHKPDLRLPPDQQDTRMVCVLEPDDWKRWLNGQVEEARKLLRQAPAEVFIGEPKALAGPMTMDLF
jgi:putative SOS response-associated peptidase YedK